MKRFVIYSLFPFLAMALIISIIIIKNKNKREGAEIEMMKTYPFISKEEEFNDLIINFHHGDQNLFRNDPYHAYITLNSGIKRSLAADVRPSFENKRILYLDNVLSVGDSLIKESGSVEIKLVKANYDNPKVYHMDLLNKHLYNLK